MTQTTENETTQDQDAEPRPLFVIAKDIVADWKLPNFAAMPYIRAFTCLNRISDSYGYESGADIIQYFLSNARGWQGETARRIKAELREMAK